MIAAYLPRKWQVFIVTYLAYSVVYITRKSFSVVKTLIQNDLNLSTYTLGTIDSVFLGTYALFQVFLPSFSDAIGVRPVLLCALWSAAFFSLTFSVSYTPNALIYSWLFEGIAHAPVFAVLVKAVSLWFPPNERGKILGVWTTSQQVGAILATSLTTFISTTFGWRAAFTCAAMITAGSAVMVYWSLPEPPVSDPYENVASMVELPTKNEEITASISPLFLDLTPTDDVDLAPSLQSRPSFDGFDNNNNTAEGSQEGQSKKSGSSRGLAQTSVIDRFSRNAPSTPLQSGNPFIAVSSIETPTKPVPMSFLDVMKVKHLLSCGVAYLCVKMVRYALLFWLPYFLITELGFDARLAGYSSMLFDVGGIFGAIASGFITEKGFKGRRLLTSAFFSIATCVALLLFAYVSARSESTSNGVEAHKNFLTSSKTNIFTEVVPNMMLLQQSHNASVTKKNWLSMSVENAQSFLMNNLSTKGVINSTSLNDVFPQSFVVVSDSTLTTNRKLASSLIQSESSHLKQPDNYGTMLILMALVGFFIAGPDSILGAASAGEMLERSGIDSAHLSTATGIVNGLGAFGGVAQGYVTAFVSQTFGWSHLFLLLCAISLGSGLALCKCIQEDWQTLKKSVVPNVKYSQLNQKKNEKSMD